MKSKLFHRFALVVLLFALLVFVAGCASSEQGKVVDEIMQHMAVHDESAAYEHMSSVSKEAGVTAEGLAAFIDEYGVLVDGYTSMSVSNMTVSTGNNETITEMSGTFSYEDSSTSQFDALLHKEGETWFVTELNINK